MRLNRNLLIFIIFIVLTFIPHSKVKAASGSLSVSKTNVKAGQSVTVSVSVNAASWDIHVSGAASINEADSSSSGDNVRKTFSTKFTPKKTGKYTVTLSGDVTDGQNNKVTKLSSSKTITVEEASSNNPSNNSNESNSTENNSSTTTTEKSSDATLRNLGVNPKLYDFSGFSKTKTSYSVDVPEDVSSIYIYAYPTSTKAKVTGIGTKSLKKGSNTFSIKVTAEDGKTTKTYSLTVNRTNEEDDENNTTENSTADNNTTNNTIENNTVNEDNRNTESTDSGLTNLEVEGYTISPAFSGDIYTYSVDLPDGTKSININTEKINDDIKVEIIGNDNLETGTNYITILVYNGDETTTYQVVANVGTTSEESIATANTNTQNAKSKIKSSWGKIIIAIIVLIFIIYLIIRHKRKNYFDDEDEDYYDTDEENNDPYRMNIDSYNPYNENLSPEKESDYSEDIEDVKKTKRHKRAKGRRYK